MHKEGNETDFETLKRELKEELCVDLIDTEFLGGYDDIAVFSNEPIHVQAYIATIKGKIKCNNEIKEALWIDRNYKDKGIANGKTLLSNLVWLGVARTVRELSHR